MDLVTPSTGLIFWQIIIFLMIFFVLAKFVWKPILTTLKAREYKIEDALMAAEKAREEMKDIKLTNDHLIQEAKIERDKILKKASQQANKIISESKEETTNITFNMLEEAKQAIQSERKRAAEEIKALIASLAVEIAEKLLKEELSDPKIQKKLVQKTLEETNIN